jgi:hypothetical protein
VIKSLVPAILVALLAGAPVQAQSSAELAEIRQQLQNLMQRVDRLEQENTALKEQNATLQSQTDYLRSEARGLRKEAATLAAESGKVKGADWAGRVALKGDLRYRHEQISDEARSSSGTLSTADRERDRVRARLSVEAKATDNLVVGIGAATTEGGDPRSSNATLDGTFSRKALDLDLAYFDWSFAPWGSLTGGKMKQTFVKPGQSMFWDSDVNPEGLAFDFSQGVWFGSAYNFWIDEVSGAPSSRTADAHLTGAQLGARVPVGAATLVVGAHYHDLSAGQGRRGVFFNCNASSNGCANGNSVTGSAGAGVLAYDFEVAEVFAEFNANFGDVPFQLWADVAENQDPDDLNLAWGAGMRVGEARNYRTWEVGVAYQSIEKDALFGQLIDSDFGGGVTDTTGWVLRGAYAPARNITLNASYFNNEVNVDVPDAAGQTGVDYERLQLDVNVKF